MGDGFRVDTRGFIAIRSCRGTHEILIECLKLGSFHGRVFWSRKRMLYHSRIKQKRYNEKKFGQTCADLEIISHSDRLKEIRTRVDVPLI